MIEPMSLGESFVHSELMDSHEAAESRSYTWGTVYDHVHKRLFSRNPPQLLGIEYECEEDMFYDMQKSLRGIGTFSGTNINFFPELTIDQIGDDSTTNILLKHAIRRDGSLERYKDYLYEHLPSYYESVLHNMQFDSTEPSKLRPREIEYYLKSDLVEYAKEPSKQPDAALEAAIRLGNVLWEELPTEDTQVLIAAFGEPQFIDSCLVSDFDISRVCVLGEKLFNIAQLSINQHILTKPLDLCTAVTNKLVVGNQGMLFPGVIYRPSGVTMQRLGLGYMLRSKSNLKPRNIDMETIRLRPDRTFKDFVSGKIQLAE